MKNDKIRSPQASVSSQGTSGKGKRSSKKHSFGENIAQLRQAVYDPSGSYTGVPEDPEQVPVQDVDDL